MSEPARPASDADGLSLLALANVALRHRWLVFKVIVFVTVAAVAYFLFRPATYTVASSFRLQIRSNTVSNITGLAAQLGFSMPATDATQTPAFYVDLLRSREILGAAVLHRYPSSDLPSGATEDLMQALGVRGATPGIRRERAMDKLSDVMTVVASPRTGVIALSVTLHDPVLAQAVTEQLIDEVNTFNLQSRKSQAGAERRFVAQRLEELKDSLRGAEDRLQGFLTRNRDYRNSPELSFQQQRLSRDVQMQQDMVSSLAQSYEQAKIEEVRDTPVITVIDQPDRPVQRDSRGILKKGILAIMLGGVLGLGIAFFREGLARDGRRGSTELQEFSELRREALDELRFRRRRSKAG
ncbi:MAG: Wzz/FepE/Etk N-terminal domain-containing protein [Gemmatimonadales bacterium]